MWQTELVEILRAMINDFDAVLYTDERLERLLVTAAFRVLQEGMVFKFVYTSDVGDQDITPDPTEPDSRDDSFSNLICLQAACIINRGDAAKAARQAISVKDGDSAIDLRSTAVLALQLLGKSWCQVYEDEKRNFKLNAMATAGAAVMGPFRLYVREAFGYNTYNGGWPDYTNLYGGL